jgi:acetoin utilization deacetylase AcuC-like enzyme
MVLRMPVVVAEQHHLHAPDGGYWLGVRIAGDEEPIRGEVLRDGLVAAGATLAAPVDHGTGPILAVHEPDFVDFLEHAHRRWCEAGHDTDPGQPSVVPYTWTPPGARVSRVPSAVRAQAGWYAMDTMTLVGPGTWDAARSAVDAAVTAADLALAGQPAAYAAVRPPGHHAGPAFYGGSCYLNSSAAAAQRLRDGGASSVAVIDLDAHHGNGTQEIFWGRSDVWYGSVHVDPGAGWFPHFAGFADERGGGDGSGATLNRPLTPGAGDEPWLEAVGGLIAGASALDPAAVVVSLGVDAAATDPESPLEVTAAGFAAAGAALAALGHRPVVFVQEGGYDLANLAGYVLALLERFEEVRDGR